MGIIETGFEGFSGLIGQELRTPAGIRCYTRRDVFSGDLKDCENGDVHGTATAETIIDTAPGVLLYIARPRSGGDLRDTVDWMVEGGVSVAALYGFGHFEGSGDGTSPDPLSALGSMRRAPIPACWWWAPPIGMTLRPLLGTAAAALRPTDGSGLTSWRRLVASRQPSTRVVTAAPVDPHPT